jgi:hypothetical protein
MSPFRGGDAGRKSSAYISSDAEKTAAPPVEVTVRFFEAKFFDDGSRGLDCLHLRTVPSSTCNDARKLVLRTTALESRVF